jgi:hypothetical protein
MKTIIVERQQIIETIAQLTHAEIDRAQWPWTVSFDPTEENPTADVRLPDRMNTQGGFDEQEEAGSIERPEVAEARPEPAILSPLDFSSLRQDFRWHGELPDPAQPFTWGQGSTKEITDDIDRSLRDEIIVDGTRYRVEYY